MLVDIGLKFYAVPLWSTLGDLEVKVTDFYVKVFQKRFKKSISLEHVDGSS